MTKITSTAFSTTTPLCFARGRNGDVYAVNGLERGLRWDTVTANVEQLGIKAPASAPAVSANAASAKYYLAGIDVVDGGFGYEAEPTVTITGTAAALGVARARLKNGAVKSVQMLRYGLGYDTPPTVECAIPVQESNKGSGATLSVTVSGRMIGANVVSQGSGYTSSPAITPSAGNAAVSSSRGLDGGVRAFPVLNQGEGYASDPTLTVSGGEGSGLSVSPRMRYRVTGVSVTSGGSGYTGNPRVVFSGNGGGAVAEAIVGRDGVITSVRLIHGGAYSAAPTATIVADGEQDPKRAILKPILSQGIIGKYWCAIRYIDDTAESKSGPIPSSISELTEIEVTANSGSLSWSWSNTGMDARVNKIELWRTSADQALVLYKVAEVARNASSYSDTLQDAQLVDPSRTGFEALPITLPNGQVNARRFNPPPQNKAVIAMFQDRAWYGVDVAGRKFDGTTDAAAAEPNALYFSELDEPESVPEVNQLVIQENVKGQDRIAALMPFGGGMVVFQERHAYRLSYVSQPILDANISLICQRGCLNQRCWDQYDGVAYVADAAGMYMLDGTNAVPLSDAIDTFWTDDIIHFASSAHFFVRVDPQTRIVRFHYTESAGLPDKALCFHPITKAWWVEAYAQDFAAAECLKTSGRQRVVAGGQTGAMYIFDSGSQDVNSAGGAAGIACSLRTSNFSFSPQETSRGIRVLYRPTTADCDLTLGLHYNNSASPRPAAVKTDRGSGFVTDGGLNASLNLKKTRSALGDATGYAVCAYSGRVDERSAGGDRHLAIALSLTRPSAESAILYGAAVEGVAQ